MSLFSLERNLSDCSLSQNPPFCIYYAINSCLGRKRCDKKCRTCLGHCEFSNKASLRVPLRQCCSNSTCCLHIASRPLRTHCVASIVVTRRIGTMTKTKLLGVAM